MIYVVEFPELGRARSWFAFDADDFARKVYATDEHEEWEIFDVVTVRELLDGVGETPESPTANTKFPAIYNLGWRHGWDAPPLSSGLPARRGLLPGGTGQRIRGLRRGPGAAREAVPRVLVRCGGHGGAGGRAAVRGPRRVLGPRGLARTTGGPGSDGRAARMSFQPEIS